MREIKFRVWDKELKVMRDARYIDFENSEVSYWLNHETDYSDIVEPFKNVELMQYTGIKDFDGKEIYEGDILTGGSYTSCEIFFLDGGFSCDRLNPFCFYQAIVKDEKLKVIGNIYENQELLNENT